MSYLFYYCEMQKICQVIFAPGIYLWYNLLTGVPKMKNPFRPKVQGGGYGCIVIIACALVFSSCENFLKGGEVARQIEETIAYNNAKIVKVNLYSNDEMGIITPDSTYDARLGFNFKLQFIPNTQNYVITDPANVFEAVSIKDNSVSRADCVEFTPIEQTAADKKEGIYFAYAKVTKAADDIRIRPKCALVPKITSVWPPNDNTSYPQDSSIKVSFNKPVNLDDFADENGNLKNITIKTGETDLLETGNGKQPFYKSPYLEDDGKTLVIPIVKGNYIITNESGPAKDIEVIIKLEGLKDGVDDENVLFNQSEYKFQYRVDSRKDENPPDFKTLRIARTEADVLNVNGPNIFQKYDNKNPNAINPNNFAYYAKKANYNDDSNQVSQNIYQHQVNKVWIYYDAEDVDSGINKLVIDERLVYTKDAVSETGDLYSCEYKNELYKNPFDGWLEYTFNTPVDGVINLCFTFYDYSGNSVQKSIDLIKDTECTMTATIKSTVNYIFTEDTNQVSLIVSPIIKGQGVAKPYFIKDLDENKYYEDPFVDNETDSFENLPVISKIEYGIPGEPLTTVYLDNLEGELYQTTFTSSAYQNVWGKRYPISINMNFSQGIYYKITSKDNAENIKIDEETIRPVNMIYWIQNQENTSWSIMKDSDIYTKNVYIYENLSKEKSDPVELGGNWNSNKLGETSISELSDGIYYVYAMRSDLPILGNPAVFYKGVDKPINPENQLTQGSIPSFTINVEDSVINTGKRTVHCKIEDVAAINSNFVYILQYKQSNLSDYTISNSFDLELASGKNYDFRLMVCNKEGDVKYSDKITKDLSYDNIKPQITDALSSVSFLSNKFVIHITANDNNDGVGVGLEENDAGEYKVHYLTSSTKLIEDDLEWKNNPEVKTAYTSNKTSSSIEIDYDGGLNKYIYVQVKDKNGNYCVYSRNVDDYTPNSLSLNYTNKYIITADANSKCVYLTDFYLEDEKWTTGESLSNFTNKTFELSLTQDKACFVKTVCHGQLFSDYPLYFYPPSYAAGFTCNLKSFLECADNEIAVFTDKPCLVQTFYCTNNLGNDKTQWISYAIEAKVQQKPESFTYKVPVEEIPTGKYYVTVIHYADGTVKMTEVKQK